MKLLKLILCSGFMSLYLASFSSHAAETTLIKSEPLMKGAGSYFTIRPDLRKCVSPICGGWLVSAVNQKTMMCPDGSVKNECYVGADMIKIPNLLPEQIDHLHKAMSASNVLIKGRLSKSLPYGLLIIDSAWLSANDQKPDGAFVSVSDNGVRCITSPCLSFDGKILNKKLVRSLASYDLSAVGASETQFRLAQEVIASGEGLPMAGRLVEVTGPGGTAHGIEATQFYLKLESSAPKFCRPTGCSGQICADSDVITTCEWRPEYACYQSASCSAQSNGDCGWVMDDELRKCLETAAGTLLLQ